MVRVRSLLGVAVALTLASGCGALLGLQEGEARDDVDAGPDVVVAVDTSPGDDADNDAGGEAGCPSGEKSCSGTCVRTDDPNYGCVDTTCNFCSGANTKGFACQNGACAYACNTGYADCTSAPGCESSLNADTTCGSCAQDCTKKASTPYCDSNTHTCVQTCPAPRQPLACGCVDPKTDKNNCGTCGNVCPDPQNAYGACSGGGCTFSCSSPGVQDCNHVASDGCEATILNDPLHCGLTCTNCTNLPPIPNAQYTCSNGSCTPSCNAGYYWTGSACQPTPVDSGRPDGNGCMNPCNSPPGPNMTGTCNGTACQYVCSAGWVDCANSGSNCTCPTAGYTCVGTSCVPITTWDAGSDAPSDSSMIFDTGKLPTPDAG